MFKSNRESLIKYFKLIINNLKFIGYLLLFQRSKINVFDPSEFC